MSRMTELRMQRALLCFLVVMGLVLLYWGIKVPDWWLAAMIGPLLSGWASCAALRLNREIHETKSFLEASMKDAAFLHELRLSGGRVDVAREAFAKKKSAGVYR
jgi:hypothetical protein